MQQPLKVLAVDDSAVYRRLMSSVLEDMPELDMVGTAPSGPLALKKIPQLQPDVVLLDIEMPEMTGIEVLSAIKSAHPNVAVVLVSGVNSRSADIVVDGLSKGAEEFIQKPDGGSIEDNRVQLKRELTEVFTAIRARSHGRFAAGPARVVRPAPAVSPAVIRAPGIQPGTFRIVGIGISTGGPQALGELIPQLPETLRVPVLIVQHMPPVFTASLARSLDRRSRVHVSEAKHGQLLEPGHVYVSPGGIHMVVSVGPDRQNPRYHTMLVDGAPVNSCRPSVDVMFQSLAAASGKGTLAVMMTGMGQDGLVGVQHIKRAGGYCLTQNRESCVVYGMPQAVDQANLSDESVALGDLADRIRTLVG